MSTMEKPSPRAAAVAQMLVEQFSAAEGFGARPDEIAIGYALASERGAQWIEHRSWPRLRDGGE